MLSVEDDAGIRTIMDELMAASKDPVPGMRRVKFLIILAYVETDSDTLFVFLRQIDFSPLGCSVSHAHVLSGD